MPGDKKPRVMVLASYYRPEHMDLLKPYHRLNSSASTWNTALFSELRKMGLEMHFVQFYPILRPRIIREVNATFHYLPRVPKIDGITSRVKALRVRNLVAELKPDLVHGIGSEHGYAYAAASQEKCPSVITIHGYLKHINKLPGHRSIAVSLFLEREEKLALLEADGVIAINGYMRDQFVAEGCSPEKIREVPNPLNPIYLAPYPDRERDVDVIMVGTIHPLKNHAKAMEIFSCFKKLQGKELSVLIVGGPSASSKDYYKHVVELKNRAGLEKVQFTGSVSPPQLRELYLRSKVLLHISEFEADPMVVCEALVSGVIPVVNPVAGLAYRVKDKVNGRHIRIEDGRSCARELYDLTENYEFAVPNLAEIACELAETRHPGAVAQITGDFYFDILINSVRGLL